MELHPNPQFARPSWIDLSGTWSFAYDDQDIGIRDRWMNFDADFDLKIQVPFPPESIASGIHDTGFHPIVWYQRSIQVPENFGPDRRLILHFGAVDYYAMVWVNGCFVGQHEGGHTPFSFDVSDQLTGDGKQNIVVRVEDWPQDLAQPRGKQGWEDSPRTIWYHRTTGIWQPVWLEVVSRVHIAELRWSSNVDKNSIRFSVTLNERPPKPLTVQIRISLNGEVIAADRIEIRDLRIEREIILSLYDVHIHPDQYQWSPEHPNLLDAVISLVDNEHVLDEITSYTGLRSVSVQNGQFLLNGHPYYLRMVLSQGYWPQSHLAAPNAESIYQEVRLMKSLGFNGARVHQKIEDPRFLYWCDKLGLLVWEEMPNAYVFTEESKTRLTREWIEAVKRDYSHPCIVVWVPVNESWGVPSMEHDIRQRAFLRALYWHTKAIDPDRLVIDNDGWEHVVTDIVSIHDYAQSEQVLRSRYGSFQAVDELLRTSYPNNHRPILQDNDIHLPLPVMLTELGGISYEAKNGEEWFAYGTVSTNEEYLEKLRKLIGAVISCQPVSGFCYTQLTDTDQEKNGLLTAYREPKLDIEQFCSIFQTERKGAD